jgi:hypothetical protein
MKAAGRWAWWNHYGTVPLPVCVERARQVAGVIVKSGYTEAFTAFRAAHVRVATERYVYPTRPLEDARALAADLAYADFVVIDAELEWEQLDGAAMHTLCNELKRLAPGVEIYANLDTRGDRMTRPYARALLEHATGVMPMIYPLAFYDTRPTGYVAAAFRDCLEDGQNFAGKPVLPTIQTYAAIGHADTGRQVDEVVRRGLRGCQAYTISHATSAEWAAFHEAPADAAQEARMEAAILKTRANLARLFLNAADHTLRGIELPDAELRKIEYVIAIRRAAEKNG